MIRTHRTQVTHKAILQAILKQLLTLATKTLKKMSYWTIPVLPPPKNPGIAVIRLTPMTLLRPATKGIVMDAASGGAWTSRTPRKVSRTDVYGSTPGGMNNSISIVENSSPDLIIIIGTDPPCGLNLSQEVGDIRQSNSPGLVRQSQKLDAAIDGKFSNNCYATSIFSNIIGDKLSDGSSRDLYTRCKMNLTTDPVKTKTPQFVDFGLATINALYEGSGISTPTTIIRRPIYGDHWNTLNNIFGETIVVGLSEVKSDYDYNYKTDFQNLKTNQEFVRQNILMSRPPLDSTPIGKKTSDAKYHLWTQLLLVRKRQTPT